MNEELKQKLTERFDFISSKAECDKDVRDALLKAYLAGADYGYQYAQAHPNWISVEDELPPKMDKWTKASDYVLVYTNEGEWLVGRYWHDGDGWSVIGFTKAKVTHWMPIIPPRKEENNE